MEKIHISFEYSQEKNPHLISTHGQNPYLI
jgi:hypothetical protein